MSTSPAPGSPHLEGRADPPQAGLRAGALPRDGRVPELRDLRSRSSRSSRGASPPTSIALRTRRARRRHLGLAARRTDEHASSRCRWPRSPPPIRPPAACTTGPRSSEARAGAGPRAGSTSIGQIAVTAAIGYGLAIFAHGRSSTTGSTTTRDGRLVPSDRERVHLPPLRRVPARRPRDQPLQHHGSRRCSTRSRRTGTWSASACIVVVLILVPDRAPVARRTSSRRRSTPRAGATGRPPGRAPSSGSSSGLGSCWPSTRSRASTPRRTSAEETTGRIAHGGSRHVHVGRRVRGLRLHPARSR